MIDESKQENCQLFRIEGMENYFWEFCILECNLLFNFVLFSFHPAALSLIIFNASRRFYLSWLGFLMCKVFSQLWFLHCLTVYTSMIYQYLRCLWYFLPVLWFGSLKLELGSMTWWPGATCLDFVSGWSGLSWQWEPYIEAAGWGK